MGRRTLSIAFIGFVVASAACGSFGDDAPPEEGPPPPPPPAPAPIDGKPVEGIYLSSSRGAEGADGSIERPVKSLRAALEIGKQRNLRVIVCAEEFVEDVELVDGVSMYGGYDCSIYPWERKGGRTKIRGVAKATLTALKLTLPTRIDGFDIEGPDHSASTGVPALSSFAMVVTESKGLVLEDMTLRGGKAGNGKDGIDAVLTTNPNPSAGIGVPAVTQQVGCTSQPAVCLSRKLIPGSAGGTSACATLPGLPGGAGGDGAWFTPSRAEDQDERGRPIGFGGGESAPGSTGANGKVGESGANGITKFHRAGFIPTPGAAGKAGTPGQGGGGGGGANWYYCPPMNPCSPTGSPSQYYSSAAGGGGGAGGCGGLAGTPGEGGGASVGLFTFASEVTIGHSRLHGGAGGRAGRGGLGSPGTSGHGGGGGVTYGGAGGSGGAGGAGGYGGHGAAGPSLGLLWSDTRPTLVEAVDLLGGSGGEGQPARSGAGQTIPAANVGLSIPEARGVE